MKDVSGSASRLFTSEFGNLSALVLKRLELEWEYHKRLDLGSSDQQLLQYAIEFGRLLNVVYRYQLYSALREECEWYAGVFGARGSQHDAFALLLDSWIIAIQGLLKPPECNELAKPLRAVRDDLEGIIAKAFGVRKTSIGKADRRLFEKLIGGDVPGARDLLSKIAAKLTSPELLITEQIIPALAEIGQRWESNELQIFQEHLGTAAIRTLLAGLPLMLPEPRQQTDSVALVSCAPGDNHELIPLALASYLGFQNWNVKNLGGGLPADQIAMAVKALKPNVLFLTCTMLSRLEDVIDVLEKVHCESEQCHVILGGRGAILAKTVLESKGAMIALDFESGASLARAEFIGA